MFPLLPIFTFVFCGKKPAYPEETNLSELVSTWPSYMPTPGIKHKLQWREANSLQLQNRYVRWK